MTLAVPAWLQAVFSFANRSSASGPASRWGRVSCRRAILAVALFVYETSSVNLPGDSVADAFFWPLMLTVCLIGVICGVMGLRQDRSRREAILGLVIQSLIGSFAVLKTSQAADEVYGAYQYNHGVIINSDR